MNDLTNDSFRPAQDSFRPATKPKEGIFSSIDRMVSDPELGMKVGSGFIRGIVGNTLKTAVQMPRAFASGATGIIGNLTGNENIQALSQDLAKPVTVPVLGEVQPLSAVPGEASAERMLGQAVSMIPEAALFGVSLPGTNTVARTSLGKLAKSFAVGAEFGGLHGAGRSMQEENDAEEVFTDAATQAITSGLFSLAVTGVGLTASGEIKSIPKEIGQMVDKAKRKAVTTLKTLAPMFTNIKKGDFDYATSKEMAPRVLHRLEFLRDGRATSGLEAEDGLREYNYGRMRDVYDAAKTKASAEYERGRKVIEEAFGTKRTDSLVPNVQKALTKARVRFLGDQEIKIPGDQSGSEIVSEMYKRIGEDVNPSVAQVFELKQDLSELWSGLERGTPAYRVASIIMRSVDSELNALTNGKAEALNSAYALFKEAEHNVKPLWGNVLDDQRLNFVKQLETQAKAGSRAAMKALEEIAGLSEGFVQRELDASRYARMFNWETAPTGGRIRDINVAGVTTGVGGALGAAFGGPFGAGVGGILGASVAKRLTSPQFWADALLSKASQAGLRLSKDQALLLVQSPLFQQAVNAILDAADLTEE